MDYHIVRDCAHVERLERGLADYHRRRSAGVDCPDPLQPGERLRAADGYDRRLRHAREFMRGLGARH
jgi:hypothetical protein